MWESNCPSALCPSSPYFYIFLPETFMCCLSITSYINVIRKREIAWYSILNLLIYPSPERFSSESSTLCSSPSFFLFFPPHGFLPGLTRHKAFVRRLDASSKRQQKRAQMSSVSRYTLLDFSSPLFSSPPPELFRLFIIKFDFIKSYIKSRNYEISIHLLHVRYDLGGVDDAIRFLHA